MEKINAGIYSIYMQNIPQEAVELQKKVVTKFNKSQHPFYQIRTDMSHPDTMDAIWHMNGIKVRSEFNNVINQVSKHDVLLFLDIDAIPVNDEAIDSYIEQAYNGILVGNIQRSNHIQNNKHVFVAPSAMGISVETFLTLGRPKAHITSRSDVAEEYTWLAEKTGTKLKFYMPLRFEGKPAESDFWALGDGMPVYGRQTTFGDLETGKETFWHNFQSFFPGQDQKFIEKCQSLLKE